MARTLSHLDRDRRPRMVDGGGKPDTPRSAAAEARPGARAPLVFAGGTKPITQRSALAEPRRRLPRAVALALQKSGHRTRKGPVFDTAIIAGVMAAKRTHELLPFCHPLE